MAKFVVALLGSASAQTLTNCNPDGPAKISTLQILPDPPQPGQPAEIHFGATFPTSGNHLRAVIDVSAGPIDIKAMTFDLNVTQKVGKPNQGIAVTIGPFTWPNLKIPLIPKVRGKVKVGDIDSPEDSPVCIEYAIKIEHNPDLPLSGFGAEPPVSSCVTPEEEPHLKIVEADIDPPFPKKGDTVHMHFDGALDEDIQEAFADINLDISVVKIPLQLPIKISPSIGALIPDALSSGIEMNIGPFGLVPVPLIPNAKGSVRVSDKADGTGETIQCINFNMPVASESAFVV
jgi:hypothetical protein